MKNAKKNKKSSGKSETVSGKKRMYSELSSNSDKNESISSEQNTAELNATIAERRKKREATENSDKFHEYMAMEEVKRQKKMA